MFDYGRYGPLSFIKYPWVKIMQRNYLTKGILDLSSNSWMLFICIYVLFILKAL